MVAAPTPSILKLTVQWLLRVHVPGVTGRWLLHSTALWPFPVSSVSFSLRICAWPLRVPSAERSDGSHAMYHTKPLWLALGLTGHLVAGLALWVAETRASEDRTVPRQLHERRSSRDKNVLQLLKDQPQHQ